MTSATEVSPPAPGGAGGDDRSIEIDGDKSGPPRSGGSRYVRGRLFATVMVLVGLGFIVVGYFSLPTEMPVWNAPKFVIHKDATWRKIEELSRESAATVSAALEEGKAVSAPREMFPTESTSIPKVNYRKAEGR